VPCVKGIVTQAKQYWANFENGVRTAVSSDIRFSEVENKTKMKSFYEH